MSQPSDTPRTDALALRSLNSMDPRQIISDLAGLCRELECELTEMRAKYTTECEQSMMAGTQNSALRLQLRDAEIGNRQLVAQIQQADAKIKALRPEVAPIMTATRVELTNKAQLILSEMQYVYGVPPEMIEELRKLDRAFHEQRDE